MKKFIYVLVILLGLIQPAMILCWPVKSETIMRVMDGVSKQTAVWHDFMVTTKAALKYEETHLEEVPQFFCGKCQDILYFNEFFMVMLKTNICLAAMEVFSIDKTYYHKEVFLNDITKFKPPLKKLKKLCEAGNTAEIAAFMLDALRKQELVKGLCTKCGSNDWQLDVVAAVETVAIEKQA